MQEASGSLCGRFAQFATKCSKGERTIILCATTNYPVAVADALKQRVSIIIRCNAFLLCVLSLGSPEVLTVGHEYCWQRLSVLLRALAKKSCSLGVGRGCAHHGVQGAELAKMLIIVDAIVYLLLKFFPMLKAYRLLVVQHLHHHIALFIAIEHHLQISRHRQNLVHIVVVLAS